MTPEQIVWHTSSNHDDTRILRQHAFVSIERKKKYTDEKYLGNISLCSQAAISYDGETSCPVKKIEPEHQNDNCCKTCLKKFNSLK